MIQVLDISMGRETRSVNKKGELELYAEDGGINR
jgi:hypothetical protein